MLNDDPGGLCGRQSIGPAPVIVTSASCAASSSGNFHFRLTPCRGTSGYDINSTAICSPTRRTPVLKIAALALMLVWVLGLVTWAHNGWICSCPVCACAPAWDHRFSSREERMNHSLLHRPPECHTWSTLGPFREHRHSATVRRASGPREGVRVSS